MALQSSNGYVYGCFGSPFNHMQYRINAGGADVPPVARATIYPSYEGSLPSVNSLICTFESCWDENSRGFLTHPPFEQKPFFHLLMQHHILFPLLFDPKIELGFLIKRDLPAGSKLCVHGDLQGDLKSLLEYLKRLQTEGLLDEQFKCRENILLAFLGDYADPGPYSLQVLQLLATLHMENPHQVILLRGNHEHINSHQAQCSKDYAFSSHLVEYKEHLTLFYDSMPLAAYIAKRSEKSESRQYVLLSHGVFNLSDDPTQLLENEEATAFMKVSKTRVLSERVQRLAGVNTLKAQFSDKKRQIEGAKLVSALFKKELAGIDPQFNTYSWGGVHPEETQLEDPSSGLWHLSLDDAVKCLTTWGDKHKIKMILKGGAQPGSHLLSKKKQVIVARFGPDTTPGNTDNIEMVFIITIGKVAELKSWKKQVLIRKKGESGFSETNESSLTSPLD